MGENLFQPYGCDNYGVDQIDRELPARVNTLHWMNVDEEWVNRNDSDYLFTTLATHTDEFEGYRFPKVSNLADAITCVKVMARFLGTIGTNRPIHAFQLFVGGVAATNAVETEADTNSAWFDGQVLWESDDFLFAITGAEWNAAVDNDQIIVKHTVSEVSLGAPPKGNIDPYREEWF
jgi:hypothetical protein